MPERNHGKKLSALLRKETFFCENFKRVSPPTLGSAFDSTSIKTWPCKYLPALSLVYLSWGCLVSAQSSLKTCCSYVVYCLSVRNRMTHLVGGHWVCGRRKRSIWWTPWIRKCVYTNSLTRSPTVLRISLLGLGHCVPTHGSYGRCPFCLNSK